jgi:alanine racemase
MSHRIQKDLVSSLKNARLDFGLTQQQLAKKTGIPRTTISKIEAGFRNTTLNTMLDLAKAVNLDLRLVKQEILKKAKNMGRSFETLNNIYIDASAILGNYRFFKKKFPNHEIWPVLKANAYGHGIQPITRILQLVHPRFIIVDGYYEALQIWEVNPQQKVLLIGALSPQNYPNINIDKVSLTIYDQKSLKYLSKIDKKVRIHLKINTGFNRQGIKLDQLNDFLNELKKHPNIILEGVMSHLASADEIDNKLTEEQENLFNQALEIIKSHDLDPQYKHLSATAGSFTAQNKTSNVIRLGLGLYGYNPFPDNHKKYRRLQIRPALTLSSSITNIIELEKGEKISYNGTFTAPHKITAGVLPLGYYEVFDRKLSNKGFIKFHNKKCPIIGNICMNMTIFDLKKSRANLYDKVKVISSNPADYNSIKNMAKDAETIPYEILTGINQNIRRTII